MEPRGSPDFLFVTYTEQPDKVSKRSLRAVRKHVMGDYFRRRGTNEFRRHPLALRPLTERLSQSRYESDDSVTCSSTNSFTEESFGYDVSPRTLPYGNTPYTQVDYDDNSSPTQLCTLPNHGIGVERIDPFDVLPVTNTIDQDELLNWNYLKSGPGPGNWERTIPWLRDYDEDYSKALWNVCMDHTGLFHILLCIGQARRSMVKRYHDRDTLFYHFTLATRFIRQRITGYYSP